VATKTWRSPLYERSDAFSAIGGFESTDLMNGLQFEVIS